MNDTPASTSIGWEISARPGGDVLAARARGHGIELMLLSRSAGHDPAQIEAWLAELIGVAVETSRNDPGDRPISALLRHALTGLLFSHAELWHHTPEDPPCSLAFVTTNDRVAFGWAGPAEVDLWVDDQPSEDPVIRVRDPDGREARAIEVESWRRVRVRLTWRAGAGTGAPAGVELDAAWSGRSAAQAEPARSAGTPSAPPEWHTPSWLAQQAPWEEPAAAAPAPAANPAPAAEPLRMAPTPVVFAPPPYVETRTAAALTPQDAATPASAPLLPMTAEERAAEIAPGEPEPPEPPQPAPLEIIRGMPSSQPAGPRSDMEIIRLPEPVAESLPSASPPHRPLPPAGHAPPRTDLARPAGSATERDLDPAVTAWASRTAPARVHAPLRPSRVRRPAWPSDEEPSRPWWQRRAPILAGTLILFAVGWMLGGFPIQRGEPGAGFMARALARIGFGPAHYRVMVDSHPQGAWIALDGRDLARRTPATLEVEPGTHRVTLSFMDLGHATYEVNGERDGRVSLDAVLWGTLEVSSMDRSVAVKVAVDGAPRGLAPVTVDSLAPGVHQVQFWSPGAGSWNQIVEVRVRETAEVAARPIASPATGMLEVRATENGESGPQPVAGATVWLDGEHRGVTPMSLDLPRGPHSVRISYRGQDSPVQVIDLPGGNQRFARFELDAGADHPLLRVPAPGRLSLEAPTVVSAELEGVGAADVREMWLHVSTPEGQWRRYAMNVLKAPGGAVGAGVFPVVQLDRRGRARFYVSVATRSGDEVFSEIQTALGPPSASAASAR